jgi:hypothetical protein
MAALPLDCRRCLRSTSRSCNDGAHLPAHLWQQKRDGRGLPFVVRYTAAMNVSGATFHSRCRCGGNENASGYDSPKLPVSQPKSFDKC